MKKIYISPSTDIIEGFSNPLMDETSWTVKKRDGTEIDGGLVIDEDPTGELDVNRSSLWDE